MKNSNNKILIAAVILLLLVNIGLVIYFVKGRNKQESKHNSGKGQPFDMMVKELNMTDQQQKDFKQLKEEHFKNIKPLFDSVRAAKTAFFDLVKKPEVNDSTINIYSERLSERQSVIDKLTLAHFRKVRSLFTSEQQPKFDSLIQKMMQRSGGPGGGRRNDSTGKKDK
jgi:Spy/CpxP family protein refolding chaperone